MWFGLNRGQGMTGSTSGTVSKDVRLFISCSRAADRHIFYVQQGRGPRRLADILAAPGWRGRAGKYRYCRARKPGAKLRQVILQVLLTITPALDDRRMVERAFIGNKIRALCATSTLAMG
jgi:hypothetical protein